MVKQALSAVARFLLPKARLVSGGKNHHGKHRLGPYQQRTYNDLRSKERYLKATDSQYSDSVGDSNGHVHNESTH
jgi:hypothetical protein